MFMQTANAAPPAVRDYDWLVVNSSAGKDGQAMLDVVCEQARLEGVLDRVVVVHADLGRGKARTLRVLPDAATARCRMCAPANRGGSTRPTSW
jgi:hypothetical protein